MEFCFIAHRESDFMGLRDRVPECVLLYVGQRALAHAWPRVIVCAHLADNIEEHRTLLTFTAWYAVARNGLFPHATKVGLFEYDCLPRTSEVMTRVQQRAAELDAFGVEDDRNSFYADVTPTLLNAALAKMSLAPPPQLYWISSTNFVLSRDLLCEFVDRYWPVAQWLLAQDPVQVGFYHERIFYCFLCAKNARAEVVHGFRHSQNRSHQANEFQRACFVTYGDRAFDHSVARFRRECERWWPRASVCAYRPAMVDPAFRTATGFDWNTTLGGGFWTWKPYVIDHALATLSEGALVCYADAGCTFSDAAFWTEWMRRFEHSAHEVFVLQMCDRREKDWTAPHVLAALQAETPFDIESGQVHATCFMLKNTANVRMLIARWRAMARDRSHLFAGDNIPNHRHDQSIWSFLVKTFPNAWILDDAIEQVDNGFGLYKARARGFESCLISYAHQYPDVRAAFGLDKAALAEHFRVHGYFEKRTLCNC